jgi:hypothetical protein
MPINTESYPKIKPQPDPNLYSAKVWFDAKRSVKKKHTQGEPSTTCSLVVAVTLARVVLYSHSSVQQKFVHPHVNGEKRRERRIEGAVDYRSFSDLRLGDGQIGDGSSRIDGRGRYYHYYIFERLLEIRLWIEGRRGICTIRRQGVQRSSFRGGIKRMSLIC